MVDMHWILCYFYSIIPPTEVHQAHALSSSFEKLAGEGVFIDKSYLIKDMFKVKKKVILLTRPPKWGKTVTLDMIKNFLNVEVNEMGEKQSGNLLLQPKMFHGKLGIQYPEVKMFHGKYIVVQMKLLHKFSS